ncbi:MAG: amidohydrolase [Acidobacteriaceae bacterium]|jgi:predicted amidohydrolase YtcJ
MGLRRSASLSPTWISQSLTWMLVGACLAGSAARAQTVGVGGADVVLVGGKVWTGVASDPVTQAVAIQGTHILATGTSAAMLKLAVPGAKIIPLNGRLVLPGFNDAHVHIQIGGANLVGVHLTDCKSQAEFRERIAAYAKTIPKGKWILNGSWDEQRWSPVALPTHQLIDDVTPDHPVAVSRTDLHMILANAYAMKLAGVDRNTKDVPGGVILRDAEGNPTGIFKDAAKDLILSKIPADTEADMETYLLATQEVAAENGVTSVQDMALSSTDPAGPVKLQALQRLEHEGRLKLRVAECLGLAYGKQMSELGIEEPFGNEMVHVGCLKSFADGGLGASTAWFTEPYTDNPKNYGIASDTMQHPEEMYAEFKLADEAGLQLITHAIGDRANHTILDMYERLEKEDGPSDRRDRIEHAQTLLPEDIPRFAQLHVIASVQPYHAIDDGRWAEKRIGPERVKYTYAFRSLMDSGAVVAFGSDWPVGPLVPLTGIYAAVTRRTIDEKNPSGWMPLQKVTVAESVKAYTYNAAYAEREETIKGRIAPGQLADLIVLSDDIFTIDPVKIDAVRVEMTLLGGQVIYTRGKPGTH